MYPVFPFKLVGSTSSGVVDLKLRVLKRDGLEEKALATEGTTDRYPRQVQSHFKTMINKYDAYHNDIAQVHGTSEKYTTTRTCKFK